MIEWLFGQLLGEALVTGPVVAGMSERPPFRPSKRARFAASRLSGNWMPLLVRSSWWCYALFTSSTMNWQDAEQSKRVVVVFGTKSSLNSTAEWRWNSKKGRLWCEDLLVDLSKLVNTNISVDSLSQSIDCLFCELDHSFEYSIVQLSIAQLDLILTIIISG